MATVGGLTFVSRIAGFARDVIISHTLGAGALADAFFVALKLPNFFRSITAEGAFSISFVPLYTDKKIHDTQDAATTFASQSLSFMIAALIPFSLLMMIFMPAVIHMLAPGFRDNPDQFSAAVEMARLSFPYLGLVTIAAILGAILNAHEKFGPYAFAPVLFNLCLIAAIPFSPLFASQGHAMAFAMSFSGALQAIWVGWVVRRMGLKIRLTMPRLTPDVRRLLKLMGPGVLVAGVFQMNLLTNLVIGSFLAQGSIAHLYYADRLYQLPFGVIGIAVGTALLPLFSGALARQDHAQARDLYNRSLEYMLVLTLPCAVGLLIAADPLTRVLYLHGAFDRADVQATTLVLMSYALGLPAYVLSRVYNAVFYAQKDTWTPVKISILTTLLNIPLSFILAYFLGVMGIALATSLMGWGLLFALYRASTIRSPDLVLDARLTRAFPRILFSTLLLVFVLAMCRYGLHDAFLGSFTGRLSALLALIAAAVFVYFPSIFLTHALPFADFKRYLTRKGRAPRHDTSPPTATD